MKISITGVSGQIGSFLTQKCLELGHQVYGLKRRSSSFNTARIDHLIDNQNLELFYGDITDYASISSFVSAVKPDIFINLAAQSHVKISFNVPLYSAESTGMGVLNCLEAIKQYSPNTKFLTMSSSEMYGSSPPKQNENTNFHPRSVYACAKLFGYNLTVHYREMGLFASNAICFNTESKFRGENFLTKKVTLAATRIKLGLQKELVLGNLHSKRSFNHVEDVVDGLLLIAQAEKADDFVVGHNTMISIEDFVSTVFTKLGMNWKDYVRIDPVYFRDTEVDALEPDCSKIKNTLGWSPKYSVEDIIDEMLAYDMELAKQEKLLLDHKILI
jgi:GDPmannose 4,6-dehydratase